MKKLLIQWLIHDNNHKLSINLYRMDGVLLEREGLKKSRAYLFITSTYKSNFAQESNNFRDTLFDVNARS